jgi:hypothetical protein
MQLTVGHRHNTSTAGELADRLTHPSMGLRARTARRVAFDLTDTQAIAVYFAGIVIEALGVALIAAFGLVLAGGAIAAVGIAIALIGERNWSVPAHAVPLTTQVQEIISSSNWGRRPAGKNRRGAR